MFLCIFFCQRLQDHSKEGGVHAQFLLFDDQKIRPLGSWEDVKKECLKSLYQPVLLLYELQDSANQNLNTRANRPDEEENEKEKEKEKEKENEKEDTRSLILRDPSCERSDRWLTTSLFSSSTSSPRKKDNLPGNKSVLRQMLEDADSASTIAKQRSDSSPPPPSVSLSSPSVSAVSSSTSLASFAGKKFSTENFTLSPIASKDGIFDFQRNESRDDSEQRTNMGQNIPLDILPIRVYENRPLVSYVTLLYETFNGKKLLGFEHGMDELGRVIFINFPKHPGTGKHVQYLQLISPTCAVLTIDITYMYSTYN